MHNARHVTLLTMILSLALALAACGGSGDADAPQTDEAPQEQVQEEPQTTQEAPSRAYVLASLSGLATEDVALVAGAQGCDEYDNVDDLAQALIHGEADLAIVDSGAASALYQATNGSVLAIDAVARDGQPLAVSVVSIPFFSSTPDEVVAYVSAHQELVAGNGGATFLRGSQMQSELSEEILEAYVEDPSSVGGAQPPDNFYFLG